MNDIENEEDDINQLYEYFIEKGNNCDGIFDIINSMPDNELDLQREFSDLPKVILDIIDDAVLSQIGIIKFMEKFGLKYLKYEKFRKIVDDCCFLIIDSIYIGAFKNTNSADTVAFRDFNDHNIHTRDMYPRLLGEYKEYISISNCNKIEKIEKGKDGNPDIPYIDEHNSYYKCKVSYDENKSEEYIIDLGATTTYIPFYDYLNLEDFHYNEFPYDGDNNEIKEKKYRRPDLPLLNKYFIKSSQIRVGAAGTLKLNKNIIFFRKGFSFFISGLKCNPVSLTSPIIEKILTTKKIFGSSIFQIKRPEIGSLLLGLDSINQFDITINKLSEDYTLLKMSEPKNQISYSLPFDDQSSYKVLLIKSGLNLFFNGSLNPFGKVEKDSIVSYNTTYKVCKDASFEINTSFKTKRSLNLVILSSLCYSDEKELKSKVLINDDIDGYIFKNYDSKLEIWLKSTDSINKNEEEVINELRDVNIIHNFILSTWLVDSNFNKINKLE